MYTHTYNGLGLYNFTYVFGKTLLSTVVGAHAQGPIPDYSLNTKDLPLMMSLKLIFITL